jgi:prepilin-type N-terminal cleavage/methylation domain-containing protein
MTKLFVASVIVSGRQQMFNGLRFALYWCYIGSMVKKNGYSLIEIIVVVGIIGILTAVGVAAYNRMNMEFQVEAEAKRAAVMLRRWQKDADSGVGSPCSDGTAYEGIRVVFTTRKSPAQLCVVEPLFQLILSYLRMVLNLSIRIQRLLFFLLVAESMRQVLHLEKVVLNTKYLFLRREVLVSGKFKNNKGSTLIEIVIVSFVVTIALVALTNLTMISVSRNRQSKEAAVATKLAQEGIEWFKGQRNNMGYEQFSTYFISAAPNETFCVDTSSDLISHYLWPVIR